MNADSAARTQVMQRLLEEARRLNSAGEPLAAIPLAEQALAEAMASEPAAAAQAYDCLLRSHTYLDHLEQALQYSYRALDSWQQAGDATGETNALCDHAFILSQLGQLQEALEAGYRALARAEALGQPVPIIKALNAVSTTCHRLPGQRFVGHQIQERALSLVQTLDAPDLMLATIGNLASACEGCAQELRDAGQLAEAAVWQRRSLDISLEQRDRAKALQRHHAVATALTTITYSATLLGEFDLAQSASDEHLAYVRKSGDRCTEAIGLLNQGILHDARGKPREARDVLVKALALADESKLLEASIQCCRRLSEVSEHLDDPTAALAYFKRYHALKERSASETAHRRARALAVLHETERAKAAAEAERLRAEALARSNAELNRKAKRLTRDALTDALTGLANRRRLDAALLEAGPSDGRPLAVALIDIDHFKKVNDTFSHLVGDAVLRRVGKLLKAGCRRADLAARYGGEEFAILFRDMAPGAVRAAAERVRETVQGYDWSSIHPELRITVSIGIAVIAEAGAPEHLLALADQRLYAAKAGGRNRVVAELTAQA